MGWEKVACWSTKAAISLKCVKIKEKLQWRAYRKSQTLFRTVPSRPPMASPFPRLGFATPPENCNRYYLRNGSSQGLQIWQVHSQGPSEHKCIKIFWRKWSVGVSRDGPSFFEYPVLSQEWVKLQTSNLAGIFRVFMRTKAR